MTNLYAFGLDPLSFYSQALGSVSNDGVNWTTLPKPMPPKNNLSSVATDGSIWIGVGPGVASSSNDPAASWYAYTVWNQWVNFRKIIYHQTLFFAAGFAKKLNLLEEQACIFSTADGSDESVWVERYQHPNSYSGFYHIESLNTNGLVAVGYQNGITLPLICTSSDGTVWNAIAVSSNLEGPLFSASYDISSNRMWIGGQGWIASGMWNQESTEWTVSKNLYSGNKPCAITVLANNGASNVIAAGASTVWYSRNGTDWYSLDAPGYTFTSAAFYQNRWYLGCVSTLNRYTGFTLDPTLDEPLLEGYHSGVQATSLLVV